jgi:hypothetical protein
MNPTAVVPNLQAFGFGDKHDKLGRIVALEEKVGLLMKASNQESEAMADKLGRIVTLEENVGILTEEARKLRVRTNILFDNSDMFINDMSDMDNALTVQIDHAKKEIMAEIKGVAQDLAKIRAWKESLMTDHPELRSTMEPASTTRRMRRPTKMSDPPPSAPPRPGEKWKQTFNYPRGDHD